MGDSMKKIPNILSAFRILLIPFLLYALLERNHFASATLLVISGITDTLDGWIARHFDAITPLGKILDPIADKLTQTVLSLTLMLNYVRFWYFFAFILTKECVMMILGGQLVRKKVQLEGAKLLGKINTVLFYLIMFILIVFPSLSDQAVFILLLIVSVSALVSGISYLPDYVAYRNQTRSL